MLLLSRSSNGCHLISHSFLVAGDSLLLLCNSETEGSDFRKLDRNVPGELRHLNANHSTVLFSAKLYISPAVRR
jgi:hypothetical protein